MTEAPRRRFELRIHISGDTWEDVLCQVRDLLPHIEDHGPSCSSVSGGPSGGHHVYVIEDPTQTHERYVEQLNQYISLSRAEGKEGGT